MEFEPLQPAVTTCNKVVSNSSLKFHTPAPWAKCNKISVTSTDGKRQQRIFPKVVMYIWIRVNVCILTFQFLKIFEVCIYVMVIKFWPIHAFISISFKNVIDRLFVKILRACTKNCCYSHTPGLNILLIYHLYIFTHYFEILPSCIY